MRNFVQDGATVALITDFIDRKYFSGLDIAEGYLALCSDGVTYFTDLRYFSAAKPQIEERGMTALPYLGIESLAEYFNAKGFSSLGLDYSKTTVKEFEEYKTLGLSVYDCSSLIDNKKAVKDSDELSLIKKACEIAQKAYHTAIKEVKVGVSELELKDRIESLMIEYGAIGPSFETIVAFGKNSAVPHHVTGSDKLKKDTPILIDMGANVGGYFSDITRTAFFGTPSQKFIDAYEQVLNANLLAEEKICAGMTTDKADFIAREYLSKSRLDKYFTHSLGHGVGTRIHEYPTLSPRKSTVLEEGTVFTVEPGVYFDGEFGIRIEDTVVLKDGKVERLFTDDKNLMIL